MKKVLSLVAALVLCLSAVTFGTVAAESAEPSDAYSTSVWHPHAYRTSGYDIPTVMTYDGDKGTVTFNGSLNAGVATTGFSTSAPSDIEDFSIKFSIDQLELPEKISWMSFGFFDRAKASDGDTPKDVYMPFNANDYAKSPFRGIVLQLQPTVEEGVFKFFALVSKHIAEDGTYSENLWQAYNTEDFVQEIHLDSESYKDIKLSIQADGDSGLAIYFNDGAWTDENGDKQSKLNIGEDLSAFRTYFNDNNEDMYFQFATMYAADEPNQHPMQYTVSELNGKKACDGTAPDYLTPKSFESGSIKTTINPDSVGNFGLYPQDVDSVEVTKFDDTDGDYASVQARATSLNMEVIDYFRVTPKILDANMKAAGPFTVEYTLPTGYSDYKVYYVNSDEEVVSVPSAMAKVENGIATVQVDNSTISKVVIFGAKATEENPGDGTDGEETGGGCGGSVVGTVSIVSVLAVLGTVAVVVLKKRVN